MTQTTVMPREMSRNESVLGGLRKPFAFNTESKGNDRNGLELPRHTDSEKPTKTNSHSRPFSRRNGTSDSNEKPLMSYHSSEHEQRKVALKEWEYEFPSLLCQQGDCSLGVTEDGVACVWNQCVSTRGDD